jgi:hypothetical protein
LNFTSANVNTDRKYFPSFHFLTDADFRLKSAIGEVYHRCNNPKPIKTHFVKFIERNSSHFATIKCFLNIYFFWLSLLSPFLNLFFNFKWFRKQYCNYRASSFETSQTQNFPKFGNTATNCLFYSHLDSTIINKYICEVAASHSQCTHANSRLQQ